jgi:hypothetical protein
MLTMNRLACLLSLPALVACSAASSLPVKPPASEADLAPDLAAMRGRWSCDGFAVVIAAKPASVVSIPADLPSSIVVDGERVNIPAVAVQGPTAQYDIAFFRPQDEALGPVWQESVVVREGECHVDSGVATVRGGGTCATTATTVEARVKLTSSMHFAVHLRDAPHGNEPSPSFEEVHRFELKGDVLVVDVPAQSHGSPPQSCRRT